MTELLCQQDSYLKEFDEKIVGVDVESRTVILDRTAFYPGGGGQPCDVGFLTVNGTEYAVIKVKKQGADSLHCLGGMHICPKLVQLFMASSTRNAAINLCARIQRCTFCAAWFFVIMVR